jgi:hypothetical protein
LGVQPSRVFSDFHLSRLLVGVLVMVMMVVVMMMGVLYHHDLRLRRIRDCEAEEEHCSEQKLFHNLCWHAAWLFAELL